MILKNVIRKESVHSHAYKFVLEICLARIGLAEVAYKRAVPRELAIDGAKKPQGFKDITPEKMVLKLYNGKVNVKDLSIAAMFSFIQTQFKLSDEAMTNLRIAFINYITTHSQGELLSQYINTEMVSNMVRSQLIQRDEFKNKPDAVNSRYPQVVALFNKMITGSTAEENFSVDSPSLLAYLTDYYQNWFGKNCKDQIKAIINERDFTINVGETGDTIDYSNYMPLEIKSRPKLKNFRQLAYNIYLASSILYSHKEEIFYDLWSREKRNILQNRVSNLTTEIRKEFRGVKVGCSIKVSDINYKEHDNYKYRRGIYNERETLLGLFCPAFENGLQISKYGEMYERLKEKDSKFQEHNARQLFTHKGMMPKGKQHTNPEIFLSLLLGLASVQAIRQYCTEANIDPLSVPSDVFRDPEVFAKTSSFEDYLATYATTSKLMGEAKGIQEIDGIPNNDQVIKDILYVPDVTYDLKSLSRLKFYTIKELLDNSSLNERSATIDLDRAKDFKTKSFQDAKAQLNSMVNSCVKNYFTMLMNIAKIEKQIGQKINDPNFKVYTGRKVKYQDLEFVIPTKWNTLHSNIMKLLDDVDFSKLCFGYGKNNLGASGHFYNSFRICNLGFNLCIRLWKMYNDICNESTDSVNMFTKLELHRDIIDLPIKLENIDSVAKLLENAVGGVEKSHPLYQLLGLSLCYTRNGSISEANSEFTILYNSLMDSGFGKFITKIRVIRDEIYNSLKVSGAMSRSPFGKYHNLIMKKSHAIDIGVISDTAANHSEFKRLKALDEHHPSHFLVVGGKAVCVRKGNLTYYVHTSGKLYCPMEDDKSTAITSLKETDKLRF